MYDYVHEMSKCSDCLEDEDDVENEDGVADEEDENPPFSEQEKVGWPENKVLVESKTISPIRHTKIILLCTKF